MKPSEILERSRSSAIRIRAIDAEIRELHDKIGVQGHTYGFHGKNDIRDPMRRVDEMIDGTIDLEIEKSECQSDITAARKIIEGMSAVDELARGRFMTDAEYVLSEYFIYAKDISDVAKGSGYPAKICMGLIRENLKFCDSIGCAGLNAARNRRYYASTRC